MHHAPPNPCCSFKLLWSPVVDSCYWPALGRRRSWILPLQVRVAEAGGLRLCLSGTLTIAMPCCRAAVLPAAAARCRPAVTCHNPPPRLGRPPASFCDHLQTCSALLMLGFGPWVEAQLDAGNAAGVTALFFGLVLLAATQDIAVDGWALTLLSKQHVGCATQAAGAGAAGQSQGCCCRQLRARRQPTGSCLVLWQACARICAPPVTHPFCCSTPP